MKANYRLTAISLLAALACSANGETLYGPAQGNTLAFADHAVSIYYTESGHDFEVVTTIGANPRHDYIFRVVTELSDGEQHRIALGGYGDNTVHATLTLTRNGDQVTADVDVDELGQKLTQANN